MSRRRGDAAPPTSRRMGPPSRKSSCGCADSARGGLMRWCALLLLPAALSLGFAPAPFAKSPRSQHVPLPQMQGTYVQVGSPTVRLVVTHDRFEYHNQGGPINGYGLRIDATKTPPTYDLLWDDRLSFVGI